MRQTASVDCTELSSANISVSASSLSVIPTIMINRNERYEWPLGSSKSTKLIIFVNGVHTESTWDIVRTETSSTSRLCPLLWPWEAAERQLPNFLFRCGEKYQVRMPTATKATEPDYQSPRPWSKSVAAIHDPSWLWSELLWNTSAKTWCLIQLTGTLWTLCPISVPCH